MGRYTGPKAKVNRALKSVIYEKGGAVRGMDRRGRPPASRPHRRRTSEYGIALKEKKKLKHHYGIDERQVRRYFDIARREPGNTGEALLLLCERRLDNAVRRAGFTLTRPQARQGVVHGHFRVNGRKVDRPSYLVKAGEVLAVGDRPAIQSLYRSNLERSISPVPSWLQVEPARLEATVTALPTMADISLPVEIGRVVELLSR